MLYRAILICHHTSNLEFSSSLSIRLVIDCGFGIEDTQAQHFLHFARPCAPQQAVVLSGRSRFKSGTSSKIRLLQALSTVRPYPRLLTLCPCADFQTSRERGLSLRSPSSPACTPDPGPGAGAVPSDRLRSLLLSRRLPRHARHRRQGAAEAGGARPRTGDHRTAAGTGTEGGCGPAEVLRR